MAIFELEADGKRYQVDAPDMQTAAASLHAHTGEAPSMTEGLGRAFSRGVPIVGGLLNKADAATNAALAPAIDPLLPDSFKKLKGKTFGERYQEALDIQKGKDKGFAESHPIADAVAEVAGGVASTGAAATTDLGAQALGLTGKTLPQMMMRGAASGAAIDATDAAVRGENPLTAGVVGGVVGGAAPAAGRLANATLVEPVRNLVRGFSNPEEEAARRVASALDRDIKAGDRGMTLQDMQAAQGEGQPAALIDAGGETTRALARSAGNTSPEGRATLNRLIDDRFESQAPRLAEWLNKTFNFPDAEAQQDAIDAIARKVNQPAYQKVMDAHPIVNVPSEITSRPAVAQAMKDAESLAKNFGEKLSGQPEVKTILSGDGYHIAEDVPNPAKTSLRYWDYVKKAMDARIEGLKRRGGIEDLNSKQKADFRGLVDAKNALVAHLDEVAPDYKQARAGAAGFFGAEDALQAGQNFVGASQKFGIPAARKQIAKMSPQEKQLFQDGYVSRLVQTIEKTGDRRTILNKIANSPAAREEMEAALGPQRAREVEARLRVEGIMDLARPAVQGNSTTARQLVELGLAGGVGGYESYEGDPQALVKAALVYGAARGHRVIDERVAKEVAKLLASSNVGQLQKGLALIAKNKNLMGAIRNTDAALASIGARGVTPTASRDVGAQ